MMVDIQSRSWPGTSPTLCTPLSEGEGTSHCAAAAPRICSHKKAQARFHFTPIGVLAIFGHILLPHLSLFLLFFQFDHAMSFM